MGKNRAFQITIILIVVFLLVVLVLKRPNITGKVVQSKDAVFQENMNIVRNESGTYEWKVKNPGNMKSIKATGSVSYNGSAKVYIEKNGTKYLLFDSAKQLFDININVLPEYKNVKQGEKILIQITLFNLRGFGSGNVTVKYSIKDSKKNPIAAEEEQVFVETQAKLVRELVLPAEIKPGTYVAFVEALSNNKPIGAGSDTFEVGYKSGTEAKLKPRHYIVGASIVTLLIVTYLLSHYGLKFLKRKRVMAVIRENKPLERAAKLKQELSSLQEAYKSGFISEKSYKKSKERIEAGLNKLK